MNKKYKNISKIIFCLSYLEVPWTLQLIEESKSNDILLISNIDNIIKQILEIYPEINVLSTKKIDIPVIQRNLFVFLKQLINILKKKKIYSTLLNKVNGADIYFFFVAFGIFESWLILNFSNKNKIYYKPEVSIKYFNKSYSFISNTNKLIYKFLFNINFDTLVNNADQYHAVTKTFLSKISANDCIIPNNLKTIKLKISSKYRTIKGKILYSNSFFIPNSNLTIKEFILKNDLLIEFLIKRVGLNNIKLKIHPRYKNKLSLENKLFEIPNYLAGNLICNQFEVVIGDSSSLLYESANLNIFSISTLEYFYMDIKYINGCKNYLNTNLLRGKSIKYFRNLNELEKLLKYKNLIL
jgi:hypothetical protein